jgi:type I restriction enzyme, R subunit
LTHGRSRHISAGELERLSNILETFNEMFGNVQWGDADRIRRLVTEVPA